ncbi:MAG: aconitase X [Candidatus Hodarchaeales archaeon]|jgi:predicted aconitase
MYLTTEEENMLAGEQGEGIKLAMQLLVDVGDFFDSEKLIPISSAHISGVSYLTGGDGLVEQLKFFVEKGCHVNVPSTLNPCGMDRTNWKIMGISDIFASKQHEILNSYSKMGVTMTCSCTPYDFGMLLSKGQHVAWAESSAVTFANTFFGARTNKEDSLTVFSAAIVGRTPYFGLHLDQWRTPQLEINVDTPLIDNSDYGLLGHIVGKAFANKKYSFGAIPVFKNIPNPRPHQIKALGAALASFGTAIYHIDGVTPEQELIQEAAKAGFDDSITVSSEDIKAVYEELYPPLSIEEEPNITVIGCPNASLEEIAEVTQEVQGKKIKKGKDFWIFTNSAQRGIAGAVGYTDILDKAGVKIFTDTCPEVFPYDKNKYKSVLTDSAKAAHYIPAPGLNGLPTYVLSIKDCVRRFFHE